jgi:diguanylate cyclase (GGDEF)-like protein
MLNISQKELATIIGQLDSALSYHEAWFDGVSQVLVCGTAPNAADLLNDAHQNCEFGNWYYNHAHSRLRENPSFSAIEPLHTNMHRCAAFLIQQRQERKPILPKDYQAFSAALRQLRIQIAALSSELQDISRHLDPLTGVYTRGGMLTSLNTSLERVKRGRYQCSIVMLDIDNFKGVNDQHGHPVGDEVLRSVGSFICNQVRLYDAVYRYGGEEFLILMNDCDEAVSTKVTERLRRQLCKLDIDCGGVAPLNITASFGLYELAADTSVSESITRADQALYSAKRGGKNRLVVWSEDCIR